MPQVIIHSLSEFVDAVCSLDATLIRNGADKNEHLLFRGQSNLNYELLPSLGRNREYSTAITIFNEERNLIELAKYRLPNVFRSEMQPIELLALMQHHGIPTRLLDITESALVALFFACWSGHEADGEVIAFKHNETDVACYPVINAIADSYRFSRGTWCSLSTFYGAVKLQPYFLEQKHMVESIHESDLEGGEWIANCCKTPFFVYAPIRSLRQQLQQGRYILFPNKIEDGLLPEKHFSTVLQAIDKGSDYIAGRIIVPQDVKQQLLSELSLMGISKDYLFSDSTDIVCKGIVDSCIQRITGELGCKPYT